MTEKEFDWDVTDYTDPQCPFCTDGFTSDDVKPIDVRRAIEKLDEYLSRNDFASAERHLAYWIEEAKFGKDERGEFSLREEQMGLFRKLGKKEEAIDAAGRALSLAKKLGIEDSVGAATAFLNAATVYKAFGQAEKGIPLFEKARAIYEEKLEKTDERLAGLYNNFALALVDLRRFGEARALYALALDVIGKKEGGEPEQAITELNLASLAEAENGLDGGAEEIESHLEKAETLLKKEGLKKDGNYAFVAEKCASVFGYYGWFMTESELKAEAERIYGEKK
ncbi:MAG: tetratricopeptide repeat protein [Clostridia bacterium]|nr:tetratricopeptide repeat protein [Clostridia bacterium]